MRKSPNAAVRAMKHFRMASRGRVLLTVAILSIAGSFAAPTVRSQIADDIIVYGVKPVTGVDVVLRFDRKLSLQSETPLPPTSVLEKGSFIARDGLGRHWITWGALGSTNLACIDNQGTLQPPVTLGHNPVNVVAASDGRLFSTTRIPLSTPGPAYGVNANGQVSWSNPQGPQYFAQSSYPQMFSLTAGGEVWLGGTAPIGTGFWWKALLVRIDPDSGDVLQTYQVPSFGSHIGNDELLAQLAGAPDGTMWAQHGGVLEEPGWRFVNTDGETVVQSFEANVNSSGPQADLRIDGQGRLYVRLNWDERNQQYADQLYRINPEDPSAPEAIYQLSGGAQAFALGPTGEEAFAVVSLLQIDPVERLDRVNLVTGVKSSVPLDPSWFDNTMGFGDPTGFIYANVVDRQGDNDGDGAPNGVETAAGSNPFDASSRPNGPKVYISFAQSNGALILKFVDPDGILNPTGGLNLGSLSVVSSQHGQIFQYLLSFLTFVQVSPDQTEVTALFGALPIAPDLKWQFEATVADKTGATGWDWQVTRPGDL